MPAVPYFPDATADTPTFVGDSEWHPLIDGRDYLTELDAALRDLGPGDSVQLVGLQLWLGLDLSGRRPGAGGYEPLGRRLVALGAAGVHVRVLLAGELIARWLPVPSLSGFRNNIKAATELRTARPPGTAGPAPLAGSVLVDWSGERIGSNHQKLVIVQRAGVITAYVAGIDLVDNRFDSAPHDTLRLKGKRWGWHDAGVRLRGPAAARVHEIAVQRWTEASTLPARFDGRHRRMNPRVVDAPLEPPPPQPRMDAPGTAVRVVRSVAGIKVPARLRGRQRSWDTMAAGGDQSVFTAITTALEAAQRYVYLEDQYLGEYTGGKRQYELYPYLRDAAERGVKIVLLGSGVRDPEDPGIYLRPINSRLNRDLRRKLVARSSAVGRPGIAVWRLQHCTVHSKILLVDDVFACIGSANLFSRSMAGVDTEVSATVSTTTSLVRELRIRVWTEHLGAGPDDGEMHAELADLDCALGIWQPAWLPPGAPSDHWARWSANSQLRPVWPTRLKG
ncbi:phospholipase D-like domain-containing protein [Jatrophihabitans sp.]|uniref:phospholipase D-like domain-containing protein n=1 Tax=Jatrophihabitans sp. TaxID=1932789 RepID=UPI003916E730